MITQSKKKAVPPAGAFARHASDAVRLGITPVPTVNGKGPKSWTSLTREELFSMSCSAPYSRWDIALRCDGLVVPDIDTDDPLVKEAVWRVLADHGFTTADLVGRRGTKGAAFLFRDPDGLIEGVELLRSPQDIPDGEGAVFFEVLAGPKRMITWPPSRHRKTGRPYIEIGRSLWPMQSADELPICTPALIHDLRLALAPFARPKPDRPITFVGPVLRPHDLDEVQRQRLEKYARTIIARRCNDLATSTGQRRIQCFQIGCRIGVYVHHGILTLDDIEHRA